MCIKWLGIPDSPDLTSSLGTTPTLVKRWNLRCSARLSEPKAGISSERRSVGFLETLNFSKKKSQGRFGTKTQKTCGINHVEHPYWRHPGKQKLLFISINFTPKTSHSCLKEMVLSYVFQASNLTSNFSTLPCPSPNDVFAWKNPDSLANKKLRSRPKNTCGLVLTKIFGILLWIGESSDVLVWCQNKHQEVSSTFEEANTCEVHQQR